MSKPSRRPNRENRPKERDRELKRQIEEMPIVVTFDDDGGNACEFDLDCDRCRARLRGDEPSSTLAFRQCSRCQTGLGKAG